MNPIKLSRLIKIATGIFLIVTFVLPQILPHTVFAVSSSTNYKLYGQVSPIVEQSTSTNYKIDSGGMPVAGESSSTNFKVQQGSIYGRKAEVTTPTPGGAPLPTGGGGGAGGSGGGAGDDGDDAADDAPAPTAEIEVIDLQFTDIAPGQVKIVFDTGDLAVAHLEYGEDDLILESAPEFAPKLEHEFVLKGLTPGTTYKFIITLRDVYFNVTESGEYVFTTLELDYRYFIDVPDEMWFAEYVNDLVDEGCLDTTSDYYYPGDDLTRAQAVKLLVCMGDLHAGVPENPTFRDVSLEHWSYSYVEIASALGVVHGYSGDMEGYFGPDDPITREQFSKMVTNAFDLPVWNNCEVFSDSGSISDWACEYVGTSYAWSVIDGYPDGSFGPKRNINRAEGAKMVVNGANPVLREGIEISEPEEAVEEEPPVSEEKVIEIEIEIEMGPDGELDYGLVDETTGDVEDLSEIMEYLLDALEEALEEQ
jgi:hypothetical protein